MVNKVIKEVVKMISAKICKLVTYSLIFTLITLFIPSINASGITQTVKYDLITVNASTKTKIKVI